MRVFRISFALFWSRYWSRSFRRSWKSRRYWLACPQAHAREGRAFALQLGPATLRLHVQGRDLPNEEFEQWQT